MTLDKKQKKEEFLIRKELVFDQYVIQKKLIYKI